MEADLRKLRAAGLDASLLERLDACTDATWTELEPLEIQFERHLRGIAPANLPPALMASLEETVRDVPFAQDDTIVRFPLQKSAVSHPRHRGWWGAAAAVALTGAFTALLIPAKHHSTKIAGVPSDPPPIANLQPHATGNLIPAGFNRGLSEASDEGVVWQSDNTPQRLLKVVYKERVTLKGQQGRTYQVEQPRVEYILVPAKTD